MNLVIDIGNSSIKAALFQKQEKVLLLNQSSKEELLALCEIHPVSRLIISSVKKDYSIKDAFKETITKIVLDHTTKLPFQNQYKTPQTLGTDRIAAVAGASSLFPQSNCLVIDAGSCITYEILTSENIYLGGSISPGINMRFRAMHTFTASLPLVDMTGNAELIEGSTEGCIRSGVVNGTLAEVESIIKNYEEKFHGLKVLICGGDTKFFETKLKRPIFAIPELVLVGLNRILEYNVR